MPLSPCALCPRARQPVPGDGPINARVLLIGEAPGHDEDEKGRCFIGRTGKETNENYLPMGGLSRDEVYFTNAIKCWPRYDRDKSDEIADSCAGYHLRAELATIKPEIVVLLGATACNLAGLGAEMHHDRPRMGELFGFQSLLWPMYHPAAGMHDYAMMNIIMDDWRSFGQYIRYGELPIVPVDEYPNPKYVRLTKESEVLEVMDQYPDDINLAKDTEFDPLPIGVRPYCLTFSLEPGTGYLIKAIDREAVSAFAAIVGRGDGTLLSSVQRRYLVSKGRTPGRGWRGLVILHNAPADIPPLTTMGVGMDGLRIRDTMVMAYDLCTMPQALKTLSYRLCGREMVEFHDLVTPYAVEYWKAYMDLLSSVEWPKPEPYMRLVPEKFEVVDGRGAIIGKETRMIEKLYKPQSITTKVKRLLTDYGKKPGPKVFKRWWDWEDQEKMEVIKRFGDMPAASITMVEDEQALLGYACADAELTLRNYPILHQMLMRFRKKYNV